MKGLVAVAALCLLSAAANAAGDADAGREHAKKANRLAAAGKCKAALPEFALAYEMLHDPAILFNRAECERKLGQDEAALSDYRDFLAGMPDAPNRQAVQRRIAELDRSGPVTRPAREAPPAKVAPALPPELPRKAWVDEDVHLSTKPRAEPAPAIPGWVVWISLGAVAVAAGAVSAWYVVGHSRTDIPQTQLGNYKF